MFTFISSVARGLQVALINQEFVGTYILTALSGIGAFVITYIPNFLNEKDIIAVPLSLHTIFTVFTFCAMFFGDVYHFYDVVSWWDSMLHLVSGVMFGMVGYLLFISLNRDKSIREQINPVSIMLFVTCFSIACGTVWEMFEFLADCTLGMNMQRWQNTIPPDTWLAMQNTTNFSNPGLIDTMKDIINDTIGTLIAMAMILPHVKRSSKYVKPDISTDQLLLEEQQLLAASRDKKSDPVPQQLHAAKSTVVNDSSYKR